MSFSSSLMPIGYVLETPETGAAWRKTSGQDTIFQIPGPRNGDNPANDSRHKRVSCKAVDHVFTRRDMTRLYRKDCVSLQLGESA